ncbi:MAG: hypothetical protein M0011_12365 [Elusimicrobia bacterium]|nr:hypothetical protein [Elusimicrobiota bacterium]
MKEELDSGEFAGLERKLRAADLSADSGLKEELRARLLARGRSERRTPVLAWLLPVFAAAALLLFFAPRSARQAAAPDYSYGLPDDGYAQCGRRGLGDYQAAERF